MQLTIIQTVSYSNLDSFSPEALGTMEVLKNTDSYSLSLTGWLGGLTSTSIIPVTIVSTVHIRIFKQTKENMLLEWRWKHGRVGMQISASCAETYGTKERRNLKSKYRLKLGSCNIPKWWVWQEKLVKGGVRSCSVCGLRTSRLVPGCLTAGFQGSERNGETKTRRKRDVCTIKRMFVFACVWKANEFERFFYVE